MYRLTKRFSTYWGVQCLSLLNFLSKEKADVEDVEDYKYFSEEQF
jgi:hypothetical protein